MLKRKKTPVVMQLEIVECGAASLAMVMAHHAKWVPLERLRVDCGVSRDGSTAKGIAVAARRYGFEATGYRRTPEDIMKIPMPCVIHWNMNHFVVLKGLNKKYAYINDPASGEIKVPLDQFSTSFTGIAISITPGEGFEPEGKPPGVMRFAKSRLTGAAPLMAYMIITGMLTAVLSVAITMFGRVFMDDMLTGNRPDWVVPFVSLFLAFQLANVILQFLDAKMNLKIGAKFAVVSAGMFMWHALRLPVDFYNSRNAGDISMRQNENDTISYNLLKLFAPRLIDVVMVVFYLFIVLQYSVLLTIIGFVSIVINYVVNKIITDKHVNVSRVSARDSGKLYAASVAGVEMIETIKSAGAEDGFFAKWSGLHASVNATNVKSFKLSQYSSAIPRLVSTITNSTVLLVGALLIIQGEMTVGIFFAFQGFLASFLSPFLNIISARMELQQSKVSMERVQDVFNYQPDVEYTEFDKDESFYKLSGAVEINNLTFGYNRLQPPLLENFSMKIAPGGSVALVGASGSGKSTIAKLASNLYKPWEGEILFDGKPSSDIPREIFTSSVSVVDQDIVLFSGSINNNVKTWDKSIEDFEVILAARDAQIHSTIMEREGGYSAEMSDGGRNFSGGERQRLEIAGALAGEPTIIVMDEATSALDAKTEYDVISSIRNRGITTIVIAHRLSTIRHCDEIIVLDKGKVVQRGSHDELYAQGGKYRELVTMN